MKLLVDFVLVAGLCVNAILCLLLFANKRHFSKYILLIFFGFVFFTLLNGYARLHELLYLHFATVYFEFMLVWISGPLLFLYIVSIFKKDWKSLRPARKHFMPFMAISIFFFLPIWIDGVFFYNRHLPVAILAPIMTGIRILGYIYLIVYLVLSLREFKSLSLKLQETFSYVETKNFGWIKWLLKLSLVISSFSFLVDASALLFPFSNVYISLSSILLIIVSTTFLGVYGIHQAPILLPDFVMERQSGQMESQTPELSDKEREFYAELELQLESVMRKEKLYLDEDLGLRDLAEAIQSTDKKTSTLLNQYMDTSFYDYINKLRVQEFKERVASEAYGNLTLMGIAYDSGFKSKTSFIRIFKKIAGMSPSEYRDQLFKDR